jgi:glycosyltransferase involved in cell wall biosynthesis
MENRMYALKDISVVIPSYNNLEYLKLIYNSVRKISKDIEVILFDDGGTDGTKDWMVSLNDTNTIVHLLQNRIGHTILYDRGFKEASGKIIGILHADMIVHTNFFDNILKHINEGNVVCGTCVEPPLHPPGKEKHIFDAGLYPNEFNEELFKDFCNKVEGGISEGIFAPWFLLKDEYFDKIGGHDTMYAPYGYEDSDLFTRMALAGFNFIQSRDALVYHFTQRGHKWTKGVGIENDGYKEQMEKTRRMYVKKFGSDPIFDENHKPIPSPKYDIGFNVINQTEQITNIIEPYCDTISFNSNLELWNDIIVEFDATKLTNDNIQFILQLSSILKDSGELGDMEWDIFKIHIKSLKEYQNDLIKVK